MSNEQTNTSETDWQGLRVLWARSFRKLPQPVFEGVIHRLLNGEAVYSICLWLDDVAPREARCGLSTWRRNVAHLRDHLKLQIQRRKESALPTVIVKQEILAKFDKQKEIQIALEELKHKPLDEIKHVIGRAISDLDATMILKYAFMLQKKRVEQVMALEDKIHMLTRGGYKEIELLKSIGAEIAKIELGHELIRSKGIDALAAPPVAKVDARDDPNSMAGKISRLGDVDRNLVRAYGNKIIAMVREQSNGRFEIGPLGADGREENSKGGGQPTVGTASCPST